MQEGTSVHEERQLTEILTADEVMRLLKVGRTWLSQHVYEIPHYRIGGILRFDRERVLEWLRSKEQGGRHAG